MKIAELMFAKIVDVSVSSLTLQCADSPDRIETLITLVRPFGIKEIVRTGTIAVEKGANITAVNKK